MNEGTVEEFLAECAVDPEVMARWQHFAALWSQFGVDRGRLIAPFPKRWLKLVAQLARQLTREGVNSPVNLDRMIERLRPANCRHRMWPSDPERPWDDTKSWMENAQIQDVPFDLIVAFETAAGSGQPNILVAGDFDFEDPKFSTRCEQRIPRTATAIVASMRRLLSCSRQIRIVEPHYSIERKDQFLPTFEKMIAEVIAGGRCQEIDLILCRRPAFDLEIQRGNLTTAFQNLLPKGFSLRVMFLGKLNENQHPRFLLSNLGGIRIDYGFDEGRHADETVLVNLMQRDIWQGYWADYSEKGSVFDFDPAAHMVELTGQ